MNRTKSQRYHYRPDICISEFRLCSWKKINKRSKNFEERRIAVLWPLAGANGFVRPWPPYMVPWANMCQPQNGISIGSAVFAGLTIVTNRHTDRLLRLETSNILHFKLRIQHTTNITNHTKLICINTYTSSNQIVHCFPQYYTTTRPHLMQCMRCGLKSRRMHNNFWECPQNIFDRFLYQCEPIPQIFKICYF